MADTDPSAPFTLRIPVRFTHTDPAGYVFFPRYFEMLQAVTEDWFTNRLGIKFADLILVEKTGQPTAHIECQFIKPCFLGEMLDLSIILEKFGNSSINLRYIGQVGGEVRLRARSVQVLVDMKTGRPVKISADLREKLAAYQDQVIPPDDVPPSRRD